MPDLGPHAAFIWGAYGVTGLAVTALVLIIVAEDRKQRRLLADLERQGIRRRSAVPRADPALEAKPQMGSQDRRKASAKPRAPRRKSPAGKPRP
jgi:heme exporter protein D